MTDSTYDEDKVRISCSEVARSHYCVSPSLKMASLTGQWRALPCPVYKRVAPQEFTAMTDRAEVH